MSELKGIEELNELFTNFINGLGYDEIECYMGTDFFYYGYTDGTGEISYTLFETEYDKGFQLYLEKVYPKMPECSMFLFSFLHELGHHVTMPKLSKKFRIKSKKQKKLLNKRNRNTPNEKVKSQIEYCNIPIERIATHKAVEILCDNYEYIHNFETIWQKEVKKFYSENEITN